MEAELDRELFEAACAVRKNSYSPYSHFAVGAAVRAADGRIFTGCNVENASYGLSLCAERCAIFAAVKEGVREFAALCVTADTPEPVSPCGGLPAGDGGIPHPPDLSDQCEGTGKDRHGGGPAAL